MVEEAEKQKRSGMIAGCREYYEAKQLDVRLPDKALGALTAAQVMTPSYGMLEGTLLTPFRAVSHDRNGELVDRG